MILGAGGLAEYVRRFNEQDEETVKQQVPNAASFDWLAANIPLFECPDKEIEEIYHFRWWTYRKHLKRTPGGLLVTEFLPSVGWAGRYNSISCAAGHHIREGRWLRDARPIEDTIRFWFSGEGSLHAYSNWITDAIVSFCDTRGDFGVARELLQPMLESHRQWDRDNRHASGLYWSEDGKDGGEISVSGHGLRPTLNSYMYAEARAISRIAKECGHGALADEQASKAQAIKHLVQERLWDPRDGFFKVMPLASREEQVKDWDFRSVDPERNVRELHGFVPWYFRLPDPGHERAWLELGDPRGFSAEHGLTTAEQRHPRFALSYQGHECQWNGPSWPFLTSLALTALAELLATSNQSHVGRKDFLRELKRYARASRLRRPDGRVVPWIDENLNPLTGDWIARTRLMEWQNGTWSAEKGGYERGRDYNHSTFCDLVISGLVGIRPRADGTVAISPALPEASWDWFCLDRVPCYGTEIAVLWDRTGERYNRGKGLVVLTDGKEIGRADGLGGLTVKLRK